MKGKRKIDVLNKNDPLCQVIQAGMFDQKSTVTERQKLLQEILTQEGDEDDLDAAIHDDEQVNQMLARSEEEFEIFQSMDVERRQQLDALTGVTDLPKLMTEDELPDFLKRNEEEIDKLTGDLDEDKIFGRGAREHVDVDYSGGMTEAEFIKAAEADDWDAINDAKYRKKRKNVSFFLNWWNSHFCVFNGWVAHWLTD